MRETTPNATLASALRLLCACAVITALATVGLQAQDYRVLLNASGEVRDDGAGVLLT